MRLFISDYDGTYLRSMGDEMTQLQLNSEAVAKWRQLGGLFGFSTGRIFPLIEMEINKYPLEIDFMVVANGALVLDEKLQVIRQHLIDPELIVHIVNYLNQERSLNFICSDGWDGYHSEQIMKNSSMKQVMTRLKEAGYFNLTLDEVISRGIAQFSVVDLSPEEVEVLSKELECQFGNALTVYPNRTSIDLSPKNISKATGIKDLLNYLDLGADQVICMGDSWNDIEMIQTYKGITVPEAPEILKELAVECYSSVREALLCSIQSVIYKGGKC